MPGSDIKGSVKIVAEPWESSSYYEEAEQYTFVWWVDFPFKRMFEKLDLKSVLELACGHGRHSERLVGKTDALFLMDVLPQNIEVCRDRLRGNKNVSFVVNNGYDFHPVPSEALTSIICYDAMVHFSPDIVESYLRDAYRVLKKGGRALLQHSNYDGQVGDHYGQNPHARNQMSRHMFQQYALNAGLVVIESALMEWGGVPDLDCLSLVEKPC